MFFGFGFFSLKADFQRTRELILFEVRLFIFSDTSSQFIWQWRITQKTVNIGNVTYRIPYPYDQLSFKEYIDPFTGSKNSKA